VPTLVDERGVLQAEFDGTRVMALPFAGARFTLLLALPATGSDLGTLLKGLTGTELARWQAGLKPQKCALALPKFKIDAKATALRPVLESLGVKTAFTPAADLRPMLGRQAKGVHLADVHHAAGITIDERGGEAVAAAAATAQGKSLALPVPPCAVDRPFVFAVVHAATGTPLFMGRVGDPAAAE
jgi:serpin B